MKRHAARSVVITDAERSQEDQLRIRQRRYVTMMLLRVVCLVLAVVLVSLGPPLVWLWVGLCAAGMVVLPWVAVILANDRLPKEQHRWRRPGALPRAGTKAREAGGLGGDGLGDRRSGRSLPGGPRELRPKPFSEDGPPAF